MTQIPVLVAVGTRNIAVCAATAKVSIVLILWTVGAICTKRRLNVMTHDELIKSIECCNIRDDNRKCADCPLSSELACIDILRKETIDELNRLNEAYDTAVREVQRKYAQVEDLRRQLNRMEAMTDCDKAR